MLGKLYVRGRSENFSTPEVRHAIQVFASYLLPEKIVKKLDVCVLVKSGLDEDDCGQIQTRAFGKKNQRSFIITVNADQDVSEAMITLAHEMVHLKQMALNEFVQQSETCCRWNGVFFSVDDERAVHYELPWEVEAHGREQEVVDTLFTLR